MIGLSHPSDQPELDYFVRKDGFRYGNSEGNRRLMDISRRLGDWFEEEGIQSRDLHYYVERGGVFLKGAAVLAGLGTVGLNNMLINPDYGARIRFRAHLIDAPKERVRRTIADLKALDVRELGLCHCTSLPAITALAHEFGERFFFNITGTTFELP